MLKWLLYFLAKHYGVSLYPQGYSEFTDTKVGEYNLLDKVYMTRPCTTYEYIYKNQIGLIIGYTKLSSCNRYTCLTQDGKLIDVHEVEIVDSISFQLRRTYKDLQETNTNIEELKQKLDSELQKSLSLSNTLSEISGTFIFNK